MQFFSTQAKQSSSTKPKQWAFLLSLLSVIGIASVSTPAQAQMYKWVGADGKVVYSSTPPPANAKKLVSKSMEGGGAQQSNVKFPPELDIAVRKNPVTLYTAAANTPCAPCNEARTLLKQNGIPFAEKTVKTKEDIDKLKQVSGDTQLPALLISRAKFSGYDSVDWRTALSTAGYPETSILPKEYRYPAPEPAAPLAPSENKEKVEKASDEVKPRTASPTGIRF